MKFSCRLYPAISFIPFVVITIFSTDLRIAYADENRQLYIVYMGSLPEEDYSPVEHHKSILQEVVTSSNEHQVLHRSYGRSFNGFAAWLHDHERAKLNGMKEVLSVFPSQNYQLHTTRSWDFMSFPENITADPTPESDIIIGVLDTGIWPESKSFNDSGLGPVPKKWKGTCQGDYRFKCNRKIIGARTYASGTIRDVDGHGTHTSSIAAGNKVSGASFHNMANGTARGGAPSSRIAAYKVCGIVCIGADILAAFDDAIADGVDVITISIGHSRPVELAADIYAIGSFHAMANGIVFVNSAGNSGPGEASIYQLAPWLISVGASSIDRMVIDKVVLGDGRTLIGRSLNLYSMGREPKYPLTYASKFNTNFSDYLIRKCLFVDKEFVKDKIMMCTSEELHNLQEYGAAGVIYNTSKDYPYQYRSSLPALSLTSQDFVQIEAYANTTGAHATILESEDAKDPLAPVVVSFSSRGPNYCFPDIMKPDVVAPGVGILAAFPSADEYFIMSGTSMSCPHAAGAIAYIKSLHPDWSPAALKSALMTTARPLNATLHIDKEFAYGSGHINPTKAADPGLIYDISKDDYIKLICGAYDGQTCLKISGQDCQCSEDKMAPKDLNYPSMMIKINATSKPINVCFTRTVTNVAHPNSTFKATITADPNLTITVVPDTLPFKDLNEKKSFEVHVTGEFPKGTRIVSSKLVWSHGTHIVTSPIIVYK